MDLQQSAGASFTAAQISGNYSFAMDGVDNSGALKHMSRVRPSKCRFRPRQNCRTRDICFNAPELSTPSIAKE